MLHAEQDSAAEQGIQQAMAAFNAAAKIGDAAGLAHVLAEDLVYCHSNAKVENKAECMAALVKSNIDFRMREGWTIQVYGGGACAMVHGKLDAYNPGDVIVPLHFMMTWVKRDGAWFLVGRHTAKLPAA
jgi:ketosteroid isomerase-like protein